MIAEAYAELYGVKLVPVLNVFPLMDAGERSAIDGRRSSKGTQCVLVLTDHWP